MFKRVRLTCLTLTSIAAMLLFSSCSKKETQLHATIQTNHGAIVVKLFENKTPKTVANFVGLADGTRLLEEGADASTAKPYYDGLIFHRVITDFMIQGGCPNGNGMGGPGYSFEDETYEQGELISGKIADKAIAEQVFTEIMLPHLQEHQGESPIELISTVFAKMNETRSFDALLEHDVDEIATALGFEGELRAKGELIAEVAYGTLCMANSGPNTNGSQFFIVTKEGGTPWLNGKHTVFGEVISGMDVALAIQGVEKGQGDKPVENVVIESIRVEHVKVKLEDVTEEDEA